MSFKHGSNAALWLGATDLTAYCNKLDTSVDVETAETSHFGTSWKSHVTGKQAASLSVGGMYDPTVTAVPDTLTTSGTVLTVGPAGLGTNGDLARLVSIESTSYKESSPVGGVVAFDWGVTADGDVGFGQVITPLAQRTTAGTATKITGPSGGASHGVAHLHATAASGNLVVVLQDSANDSSYTAIAGGTFATLAGAGSQRLSVGTAQQYVRATYTLGTATFAVAFAHLP